MPSVCGLALLVGGILILNPTISDSHAYAESDLSAQNWTPGDDYYTGGDSGGTGSGDSTTPTLELSFAGATSMQAIAETDHTVTMSNNFTVKAANATEGYYVAVQAANGLSGNLIGRANPTATLTGVGDKVDTESFGLNTWGYAMTDNLDAKEDTLTYSTLPAGGATLTPDYASGKSDEEKTFKLAFAARFGNDLPADHYETSVMVSAVANANEVVGGFKNITFMQDMTKEICAATTEGYAKQLQDTRDNKWYWVTKLKDGNCWMTQNLDYDLSSGKTEISEWPESGSPSIYYDPGDYIYTKMSGGNATNCNTETGLETCADKGWTKLTNDQYPSRVSDFSATPTATEYNAHYHVGNYYSWVAAVGNNSGGENVQGICQPAADGAKWVLPDRSSSFRNLLSKYGLDYDATGTGNDQLNYAIYSNPLYFVYGGLLEKRGRLNLAGYNGYYWSATLGSSSSDGNPYYLYVGYEHIYPSGLTVTSKHCGYSVRCLFKAN